jgi:putative phosphotransacetylase
MKTMLPIAMSDIHVHLEARHVEALFGKGHELAKWRELTIPGQFACYETVVVVGPAGSVAGAVVVGPPRAQTQVEISLGNGVVLGIQPPVRESGRLEGTPGATLVGSAGRVELPSGVIAAARHIHMHPRDAREYGVADGQRVRVRVPGERALVFEQVLVRVSEAYALEMHIDVEEGRAAAVTDFQLAELLR